MKPNKRPFMLQHLPLPEQQFHAHSDETLIVGTNTGVTQLTNHLNDITRKSPSNANNKSN